MERSLVLCSAGLDSAVLVALEARDSLVQPVYVSVGLAWETAECALLDRLVEALNRPPARAGRIATPVKLEVRMLDVYPAAHWAVRGTPPAYHSPDEEVYLEGRNVVLLAKAGVFAAREKIGRIALGSLAANPFPDATPEFFTTMARALSLGLDREFEIVTPLSHLHKEDVIKLGAGLDVPFELTMSCMNPVKGRHCGRCSKCRERHYGFRDAEMRDPTEYATDNLKLEIGDKK